MDQQKSQEPGPAQIAADAFLALRLPSHLTLDGLIAIVAARRQRRIEIEATTIPSLALKVPRHPYLCAARRIQCR